MARRKQRPAPRWQQRLALAETPEDRLAITYDRLRALLADLSRKRRDPFAQRTGRTMAATLAGEAADTLARMCEEIERTEGSDAA